MIRLITAKTGLKPEDAYMLCSLQADLHVTQTVGRQQGHPLHDREEDHRQLIRNRQRER